MPGDVRLRIVNEVTKLESKLAETVFPKIGSIYCCVDGPFDEPVSFKVRSSEIPSIINRLPENLQDPDSSHSIWTIQELAIGPLVDKAWLKTSRGPCVYHLFPIYFRFRN